MTVYQIKDWQEHFENHESRKVKGVRWVALPNKHDGKGFRRVAAHPESVSVFCAWTLILQVASKTPVRGVLADEDGPLDSDDLAAMTGFPAQIFDTAFNVLTDKKIGWLETVEEEEEAGLPAAISRDFPQSPAATGKSALEGNGREGNRMEREGMRARAESPAVAAYREVYGKGPPNFDVERIENEVADCEVWRRVLKRLHSNGTPAKNIGTMLEVYAEAIAKGAAKKSGVLNDLILEGGLV
jgi:hypothetical protein